MVINPISLGSGSGGLTPTIQVTSKLPVTCTYDATLLPPEYQEVEHIESHGTEYIDTLIPANGVDEAELSFMYTGQVATADQDVILGSYSTNKTQVAFAGVQHYSGVANREKIVCMPNYTGSVAYEENKWYEVNSKIVSGTQSITVDGVTDTSTSTITYGTANYFLFGCSKDATLDHPSKSKIRKTVLRLGGAIVRNFKPCRIKATNEYGMFDLVSMTFFGNKGSGAFTGGADVYHTDREITPKIFNIPNPEWRGLPEGYTQVKSIIGDGNAYIDTGVILDGTPYHIKTTFSYPSAFAQYSSVGGCRNSGNTAYFNLYRNGTNFELDTKNSSGSANAITLGVFDSNIHSADITIGGAVLFDNVSKGNCAIPNTDTSLMLFGFNEGTSPAATSKSSHILYDYDIDGVLDLVPCYNSSNEYGMYDMVSHTFFGNSGTGAFTGGEEVPQYIGTYYVYDNLALGEYEVSNAENKQSVTVDKTARWMIDMPHRLPDGYIELKAIRSQVGGWNASNHSYDEGSYIDTGYAPYTATDKIKLGFTYQTLPVADGINADIFGSRYQYSQNAYEVSFNLTNVYLNINAGHNALAIPMAQGTHLDILLDHYTLTVNGLSTTISANLRPNLPLPIGCLKQVTSGYIGQFAGGDYEECIIYTNDVIVYDFVPCIRTDGAVGYYDIVNDVMHESVNPLYPYLPIYKF